MMRTGRIGRRWRENVRQTEPHTPGPWFTAMNYECETLVRAGDAKTGMRVATTFASHAEQANAETRLKRIRINEANARLIAAAPCLLKALERLVSINSEYVEFCEPGSAYDQAQKAIAKATQP